MHIKSSYCQLQLPWRLQNELYILVAHMSYITEELCAQYIYMYPATDCLLLLTSTSPAAGGHAVLSNLSCTAGHSLHA